MFKNSLLIVTIMLSYMGFAGPRPMHTPHHRPAPIHRHVHHPAPRVHHHHSPVVPIVSGVIGGLIGSAIYNSTPTVVQSTPVIVQTPVVVNQLKTIWQPGHYEDQVQSNGVVVRVWVPGRYVVVP